MINLNNITQNITAVRSAPAFFFPTWDDYPLFLKVMHHVRHYGWPMILVIGTFGNIMSAVVFSRGTMRLSTSALIFRLLAISELLFLFAELGPFILDRYFNWEWLEKHTVTCKIVTFLTGSTRDIAAWCLAFVAVERLIGVAVPHKAKVWITRKRTKAVLTILVIVMMAFNSLYFVITRSLYITMIKRYRCELHGTSPLKAKLAKNVSPWANFLVYLAVPIIIMVICNIGIIFALIRSARMRSEVSTQGGSGKKMSSMTTILLVVCFVYFALSLPFCVQYLAGLKDSMLSTAVFYFCATCQYVNHSCNFFLYCLSGARFRQELVTLFSCCQRDHTQ